MWPRAGTPRGHRSAASDLGRATRAAHSTGRDERRLSCAELLGSRQVRSRLWPGPMTATLGSTPRSSTTRTSLSSSAACPQCGQRLLRIFAELVECASYC